MSCQNYHSLYLCRSLKDIMISIVNAAFILILASIYHSVYFFKRMRIITCIIYNKQIKVADL